MGNDNGSNNRELISEALNMMNYRDEPADRSELTPPPEELSIDTVHALGLYKSRYCRELDELLEDNRKYRKKRWLRSAEIPTSMTEHIRRNLDTESTHPAKRLMTIKEVISETYFRGFDIKPLMKLLDVFCSTHSIDDKIYNHSKEETR